MKKMFLEAGKIVSTHGIKGEVRVQSWCDTIELFCEFDSFYLDKGKSQINIEQSRPHKNVAIVKIEGVDTVEKAQSMRNKILYINRDELELPEDTYFIEDMIGCVVVNYDDQSIVYGKIVDITQTGANDVYHVKNENNKLLLVPAIPQVVKVTDIDNEIIKITPLEGLFDED